MSLTAPRIQAVLQSLQIPTEVRAVYLVGSRLWGTDTPKSDFDLLVIVADPAGTGLKPPLQKSQHKGQYDVTLLSETEFQEQVEQGSLIETVCALMGDSEDCVLVHDAKERWLELIEANHLKTMRIWADERAEQDQAKAMKFWSKGADAREKGWKILQHSIAAECILRELQKVVDAEKTALGDFRLTRETLQLWIAGGREGDEAWLGLEWTDVKKLFEGRLASVRK